MLAHQAAAVFAEQVVQGVGAIGEGQDVVVHPRPADVPLDQARVTFIVLDHDDADRISVVHDALPSEIDRVRGRRTLNVLPSPRVDSTVISPPRRRTRART